MWQRTSKQTPRREPPGKLPANPAKTALREVERRQQNGGGCSLWDGNGTCKEYKERRSGVSPTLSRRRHEGTTRAGSTPTHRRIKEERQHSHQGLDVQNFCT
ncbi:hypothetical protein CgunFtcFv8_022625 [Champsocephalus gunnari]|uniref:Uncharacterized protein n=1 Tax=Champsocephalus gunnari TaxID=52237 RepID=A0AAN8DZD6_CHAGU|nr:hypothetical protein CgunFtcFv8_022625 [Champsocephalus gunnari]